MQWVPTSEATTANALLRWLKVYPLTLMCAVREDHVLAAEVRG
jgi:hypothetical protein